MSKVLVIAEHNGTDLSPATAKTLTGALAIGAETVEVGVFGHDPQGPAQQAAELSGVTGVKVISDAHFAHPLAAHLAPQIAGLADDFTHIFAPSTTFGRDLLPRVAGLLRTNQISDVMEVLGDRSFKRPIYAGNAIVRVNVPASSQPILATIRTASFAATGVGGSAPIESIEPHVSVPAHTRYLKTEGSGGEGPDLSSASVVVSGGRALGSTENFEIIYSLANKLGAAVGASRAAVDAGYVPNELQVGQTGKIIAPDLYIAVGISGAIQHLTGIKDAGTIVAINKDGEAPIFEVADFGLVGDLFELLPELERAL